MRKPSPIIENPSEEQLKHSYTILVKFNFNNETCMRHYTMAEFEHSGNRIISEMTNELKDRKPTKGEKKD